MTTIDTTDLARVTGGNPFGILRNIPGLGGLFGGGPQVQGQGQTAPGCQAYNSGSNHGAGSINMCTQAPPPAPAPTPAQ